MQLLIQRGQRKTRILRRPIFNLWAKFDCIPEENALISKYQVSNYLLIEGRPGDFRRSVIKAGILTVLLFLSAPILIGIMLGVIFFILGIKPPPPGNIQSGTESAFILITVTLMFFTCWFLLYRQLREEIKVSDILLGRFFKCKDIVTLITREQEFAELGDCFRQLLEAMKNWGGREVIKLRPYKAPPLRIGKLS